MPLITVVLTLIVVGVLLWLINTYIPMQATIKKLLNIVVVIVVVLWLLYAFGVINQSGDISNPLLNHPAPSTRSSDEPAHAARSG
jgi:hypothetical protein